MLNMKSLQRYNSSRGFTLVEMMIIAPMLILIIGSIVVSIITLTGESIAEGGRSQLINDVHDALDRVESDARTSGSYLATNNFYLRAPQGANDTTQKFLSVSGTGDDTLILNAFFTTMNPANPNRSLIYVPNTPFACNDASLAQNQVMTMNIVYFVKDSTLWRRLIATEDYASTPCPGISVWQQPSCSSSTMATNTTLCKAKDEQLLTGVSPEDFKVTYYLSPSDTTPAAGTEDPDLESRQTAIDKSSTVQISLKATKTVAGREIIQQGTIRTTRTGSIVKYSLPSTPIYIPM
jgi:competence protein ComGC